MSAKPMAVLISTCVAFYAVPIAASGEKDAHRKTAQSYPVVAGIGAALSMTDAGARIEKIVPGSAAAKCEDLNAGDVIVAVRSDSGESMVAVKGKTLGDVVSLIRGPVGTPVTLKVLPQGGESPIRVTVKREAIAVSGLLNESTYERLIGQTVSDVAFSTLSPSERVTLRKFEGRIVIVDFWASWCGACYVPVDKMQELVRSHPEWKDRVTFITATVDSDLQAASKVIEARKWTETLHLAITREQFERLKLVALPVVLIVSRDGKVVTASDPHAVSLEKEMAKLLTR